MTKSCVLISYKQNFALIKSIFVDLCLDVFNFPCVYSQSECCAFGGQ